MSENSLHTNVSKFIDEKIAPGIMSHGGEIVIVSLEEGVLTLKLTGACDGCSVQAYTSESISNYLLDEFPDLEDVIVRE